MGTREDILEKLEMLKKNIEQLQQDVTANQWNGPSVDAWTKGPVAVTVQQIGSLLERQCAEIEN